MTYHLDIGIEDRDTVVLALQQAALVAIEAGEQPYVGETLRLYVESINGMLRQLDAEPVTIPTGG